MHLRRTLTIMACLGTTLFSASDRARVVASRMIPKFDGGRMKVTLMEVRYGPGEGSPPHTHGCPVLVYVAEGAIQTQVKGEQLAVYKAGESFYEDANGVHMISANASKTEPARFLAYFVCDRDAALSSDVTHAAMGQK